tara:strand:- start:977 stop:1402 length:426 start_codon:yes stop_codon:yes gene_type:complete
MKSQILVASQFRIYNNMKKTLATLALVATASVQAGPYAKYIHVLDYTDSEKDDSTEHLRLGYETEGSFYAEAGVITNHLDRGVAAEFGYVYELVEGFTFDLNWEGVKRDNSNDVMNEDGVIEHVGSNKLVHQFEAEIKFNF